MAQPGEYVGPYRLLRRLGRGGMAETFVARRTGPGGFVQDCCVKCVLPQFADDPVFRDQFLDEATLHGRLQHGNIVRVQDFGEHAGTYFLVMELVDGCDLVELTEHRQRHGAPLPPALAVLVALDLCQALGHAHDLEGEQGPLGVVHRDLTPSNVLLTRAGEVKLSDFGIARAAHRRHRTQTGYTKGKFCYMSPEQIEAARDIDGRADLFALGCVLYEMLAGVRPFDAPTGNDLAVLPRILAGEYTPLAQRVADLEPGLCAVVERLLARERTDRPATAREVLEALAPFAPPVTARDQLARLVEEVAPRRPSSQPPAEGTTARASYEATTAPAYYAQPTSTAPLPLPQPSESDAARAATRPPLNPGATEPVTRRRASPLALGALVLSLTVAAVAGALAWQRVGPGEASAAEAVAVEADEAGGPTGPAAARVPAGAGADSESPRAQPGAVTAEAKAPSSEAPGSHEAVAARRASAKAPGPEPAGRRAAARRSSTERDRAPTSDLRIVVVPYGHIWVDGELRGENRLRAQLPTGRHRIGVGRGSEPTQFDTVVLGPGPRTLEYQLEGTFE